MKTYDVRDFLGYRKHRVSRRTGTTVVLLNGAEGGYDTDGGLWQTLCDDHDEIMAHDRYKNAYDAMLEPASWCETCMENMKDPEFIPFDAPEGADTRAEQRGER